jgi:hypothetical protein
MPNGILPVSLRTISPVEGQAEAVRDKLGEGRLVALARLCAPVKTVMLPVGWTRTRRRGAARTRAELPATTEGAMAQASDGWRGRCRAACRAPTILPTPLEA